MSRPRVVLKHGTHYRYKRDGCRCPECGAVNRAVGGGAMDPETGRLLASCWCGTDLVLVDPADVFAGLTKSCGRKTCSKHPEQNTRSGLELGVPGDAPTPPARGQTLDERT